MAKTIKQLALEYANENYKEIYALNIEEDLNKEARAASKESFEAGANAVLEQIEQLIYEKHVKGNLPLFDLTFFIDKLKEK